jgi:hypothetical protein
MNYTTSNSSTKDWNYYFDGKMIRKMEKFLIKSSDGHIYGIRNVVVQNVARVKSMWDELSDGSFGEMRVHHIITKVMNIYCYSDLMITKEFGWQATTLDDIERTFTLVFKKSFNGVEEFKIIME